MCESKAVGLLWFSLDVHFSLETTYTGVYIFFFCLFYFTSTVSSIISFLLLFIIFFVGGGLSCNTPLIIY